MKAIFKLAAAAFCVAAIAVSCKTAREISGEYVNMNFETECLGIDPSGLQSVRAWGRGIDKSAAIEQAKRNAVEAVVFNGLREGGCDKRPLVATVNAREKFAQYFSTFFAKGGAYRKFIKLQEKDCSRIKSDNAAMELWSVTGVIDREALRNQLIADGIIK